MATYTPLSAAQLAAAPTAGQVAAAAGPDDVLYFDPALPVVLYRVALDGATFQAMPTMRQVLKPPYPATAPGQPGQWAVDSAHMYFYAGNGTTRHSWVKIPTVPW